MLSKKLLAYLFMFLFPGWLSAAAITLINDSAYPLRAILMNAMGVKVGTVTLSPGQSYIWYDTDGSFRPTADATTTPYTVRWLCPSGRPYNYSVAPKKKGQKIPPKYENEYGIWEGVPCTATVNAQGCNSGQKTCVIKKSQQPPKKPPVYVHAAPKRHPNARNPNINSEGYGRFTNDGGLSWTNDGGKPFGDFTDEEGAPAGDDGSYSTEIEQQ